MISLCICKNTQNCLRVNHDIVYVLEVFNEELLFKLVEIVLKCNGKEYEVHPLLDSYIFRMNFGKNYFLCIVRLNKINCILFKFMTIFIKSHSTGTVYTRFNEKEVKL